LGTLNLGFNAGSSGAWSMSNNATLNVGVEELGFRGSGTFHQTGGVHTDTIALEIGAQPGSSGVATLSGGRWNVGNSASVGAVGSGTFFQSGGTFTAGVAVRLGTFLSSPGILAVTGGTFSTPLLEIGQAASSRVTLAGNPGRARL